MQTDEFPLRPPSLEELVEVLTPALDANYKESTVSVATCPDLRQAPFHLAAQGLSGRECIADIGGQPNLFPEPRLETKYSMISCARQMGMSQERGMLIGAGAGPWFHLNTNSELAPNFSWEGAFDDVKNSTYFTKVSKEDGWCCLRSKSEYGLCAHDELVRLSWVAWSCSQNYSSWTKGFREKFHGLHSACFNEKVRR